MRGHRIGMGTCLSKTHLGAAHILQHGTMYHFVLDLGVSAERAIVEDTSLSSLLGSAKHRLCVVAAHSVVSDSVILRTGARQAPLSMRFSGQEYWSGLPFPSPGDLPDPGIEPVSPSLADGFFTAEPSRRVQGSMLMMW